ncbi:hypothetical protein [Halorussus caseinilyticus]|uniref:Uncharacterized protein n=1 Tax=Halorussus caseinilyticus TaxID=3034025 RepID=A0ABD5WNG4_9EURY
MVGRPSLSFVREERAPFVLTGVALRFDGLLGGGAVDSDPHRHVDFLVGVGGPNRLVEFGVSFPYFCR